MNVVSLSPHDMSTHTEFCPDRLRFAGLIPERLIISDRKENTINRLLAYNYSATSNNTKLVHWPLMGGLLHLVQRGGA